MWDLSLHHPQMHRLPASGEVPSGPMVLRGCKSGQAWHIVTYIVLDLDIFQGQHPPGLNERRTSQSSI